MTYEGMTVVNGILYCEVVVYSDDGLSGVFADMPLYHQGTYYQLVETCMMWIDYRLEKSKFHLTLRECNLCDL